MSRSLARAVAELGNLWKIAHPMEYRCLSPQVHTCDAQCPMTCVSGYVHRTPDALHACFAHPCEATSSTGRDDGVEMSEDGFARRVPHASLELTVHGECWVCRSSGCVHLCGVFCSRWEIGGDSERVCRILGIALPNPALWDSEQFQRDRGGFARRPWAPGLPAVYRAGEIQMPPAYSSPPSIWTELPDPKSAL